MKLQIYGNTKLMPLLPILCVCENVVQLTPMVLKARMQIILSRKQRTNEHLVTRQEKGVKVNKNVFPSK